MSISEVDGSERGFRASEGKSITEYGVVKIACRCEKKDSDRASVILP